MKKLKLSIIATSCLIANIAMAADITRLAYVQNEGAWTVSGYSTGEAYSNAVIEDLMIVSENRRKEIENAGYDTIETNQRISELEKEFELNREKTRKDGVEADIVLKNLESGMTLSAAQSSAAAKMIELDPNHGKFKDTYDPEDASTSYNAGSVTSQMMSGNTSVSTAVNPSKFKQFNELDCSYEEVNNYLDKSKSPKTKAFSTSPSFSNTFKKTASKSAAKRKGEDEAECQTIFHDINFDALDDLSISSISAGLPSFDSFGSMMSDLGNKAGEQLGNLAGDLYGVLREGFCSRLSSDYVGDLAGDLVDDVYKQETKGTNLEGTKVNKLDTEAGQNSFTYKVIKNQSEMSDSNLIKAIDVTRDDQAKYQEKYFENELDDAFDDLEDDLFG